MRRRRGRIKGINLDGTVSPENQFQLVRIGRKRCDALNPRTPDEWSYDVCPYKQEALLSSVRSETYILGERERTSRNRASSNILSPIRQREVTSATRNTSLPVKNKIRRALSKPIRYSFVVPPLIPGIFAGDRERVE